MIQHGSSKKERNRKFLFPRGLESSSNKVSGARGVFIAELMRRGETQRFSEKSISRVILGLFGKNSRRGVATQSHRRQFSDIREKKIP